MKQCPNAIGFFIGMHKKGDRLIGVKNRIACKKWNCPVCGERKVKHLRSRIYNGMIGTYEKIKGFRDKYSQKFLTLTCPGKDWRNEHTIPESYRIMSKNFTKLMKAVKKKYGAFLYFRVVEPQQDGYPHYHVLLVGNNIASKEILQYIERLWRERYGMGFVRLNVITNSIQHGIRYLTKYLTKSAEFESPVSGMRLFTASKGALEPIEKKDWIINEVKIGFCKRNDNEIREYDIDPEKLEEISEYIIRDFLRCRGKTEDDIDSLEVKILNMEGDTTDDSND